MHTYNRVVPLPVNGNGSIFCSSLMRIASAGGADVETFNQSFKGNNLFFCPGTEVAMGIANTHLSLCGFLLLVESSVTKRDRKR